MYSVSSTVGFIMERYNHLYFKVRTNNSLVFLWAPAVVVRCAETSHILIHTEDFWLAVLVLVWKYKNPSSSNCFRWGGALLGHNTQHTNATKTGTHQEERTQ